MALWLRLPLFWRFQLAGWGAFVAITFPLKLVLFGSVADAMLVSVVRDGSSFLLTLALHRIYRAYWSGRLGHMSALIIASCAVAGLLQAGFFLMFRPFASDAGELTFNHPSHFSVFYERTGLLCAWSFLYFGILHVLEGVRRELRLALIESEKRQAQLQMLRAQINPHFLFNALNSVHANVCGINAGLGCMIQSLADFLRFSLDHSRDDFIPIGREFDAMRDYLEVEQMRFRGGLEFHCEINEDAREALVPGIILQPLVENAIKYGRETSGSPLRIRVNVACLDPAMLQITVRNSGRWQEPAFREKESHIGLQNLRRRLGLLYPNKHRLDITHCDGWVTISIRIPAL